MSKYRAGVIGLGRMGSTFDDEILRGGMSFLPYCHGPSYYHSPLVDLVAGADLHPEQRSIFGERWGLSDDHLYSDYNDMLVKEQLDFVSVCTSARHRSAIVQDVARAGVKAIWAEKPISLSLEEADVMIRVCHAEDVKLAVNCQRRWNPMFTEAKRIIESGDLGRILQVTAYARVGLSINGSHVLDTMCYLAGSGVKWIFGEIESDEVADGNDDPQGNGYLAFDNGVRGYICSMSCPSVGWEFDVLGEKARIRCMQELEWELIRLESSDIESHGFRPTSTRFVTPLPAKYPFPWPKRMQGNGLFVVEDLVESIEEDRQPACSGEDGLTALEVAIAMRESHRRGGVKVTLPLADRSLKILSSGIQGDDVPKRIRALRTD